MQVKSLQVTAPAKINLLLRALERRPDGYHELETLMTPLALADTVTLETRAAGFSVECNLPDVPTDESNLAIKAAKIMADACGIKKGVHICLNKSIPVGGGLGGGSSNAAATLSALNSLWEVNAPLDKLHELAAQIGSDVPFFLYRSAAFCRGRGEQVQPLRLGVELGVLLINPGFGISTKWAYEQLHAERQTRKTAVACRSGDAPTLDEFVAALRTHDVEAIRRGLINTLEVPCLRKYPLLLLLKEALLCHGALGAMMSGSGSTVFGLTQTQQDAEVLLQQMRKEFGPSFWMCVTNTVDAPQRNG